MAGFEGVFGEIAVFLLTITVAGVVAGLIAGLLGVGGGIVVVPVLYNLFAFFDIDDGLRMKIAVATSLATIVATSAVSVNSHHKRGAIDFALLRSWGVAIFFGVILGTVLGGYSDGRVLTAVFAIVALVVSFRMFLSKASTTVQRGFPGNFVKRTLGLLVGSISAMMGIGGGTLSVPILTAYGFDIRSAVGTASAIGFIIAIPGTVGYAVSGLGVDNLPPFSIGYLNVAAVLALAPLTMAFAPMGARLAHSIPPRRLQLSFALFLSITSARMFYDLYQSMIN